MIYKEDEFLNEDDEDIDEELTGEEGDEGDEGDEEDEGGDEEW